MTPANAIGTIPDKNDSTGYIDDRVACCEKYIPLKITVAKIAATSNPPTTASILLVSVDNSQMHISNSLKTQRNNRVTLESPSNEKVRPKPLP